MLSRAFTKPRRSPKYGENSCRSLSIHEYEDCIIGFMDDLPVISCSGDNRYEDGRHNGSQMTLREVLRASVGVIGESRLGVAEKVVLLGGEVCAVKRFRKVIVRKREFGRRIEHLADVSRKCEYLVPVTAYLYEKRIKFVVCDYYPMGSLADLLGGARELGHTALDWKQRLKIVRDIAQAIAFIHSQCPQNKQPPMNVHGNIKASNVMINIDFTAHVSNYGFAQLAEPVEVSDTWQRKPPPSSPELYCESLSQKSDVYNFGIVLLDMLGGLKAPGLKHWIVENKEEINKGHFEFFEFSVDEKERNQALQVLDIALACTNSPEARPSMEQILLGARELGHTALDWKQRLKIVHDIAQAIAFIHSQCPQNKQPPMNVHGNIKASNVMINIDFTAHVSNYGFAQLAEPVEVSDTWQRKPPPSSPELYCESLSQKSDVYNFGIVLLDMLGGLKAPGLKHWIVENKEEINKGHFEFFEFSVDEKERNQALQVLDIALACTNSPEARPSMEQILLGLGDFISKELRILHT
ncbi:unnamed protein product [Ilex paraguariensis]|uniref:Protein kinase domain-containing protein n=1 Tax=Ilex paraguariensis TaxID=185542 RepID=A0ABC8RFP1_9AQUA